MDDRESLGQLFFSIGPIAGIDGKSVSEVSFGRKNPDFHTFRRDIGAFPRLFAPTRPEARRSNIPASGPVFHRTGKPSRRQFRTRSGAPASRICCRRIRRGIRRSACALIIYRSLPRFRRLIAALIEASRRKVRSGDKPRMRTRQYTREAGPDSHAPPLSFQIAG